MLHLMDEDKDQCTEAIQQLESQIVIQMVPVDDADAKNAIVELRPGTTFTDILISFRNRRTRSSTVHDGCVQDVREVLYK